MFNPYLYCLMCQNTNGSIAPVPLFVPQPSTGPSFDNPSQQSSPGKVPPNAAPKKLVFKKQPAVKLNKHPRKCEVETCSNRVVQGGLCIAHGSCNFLSYAFTSLRYTYSSVLYHDCAYRGKEKDMQLSRMHQECQNTRQMQWSRPTEKGM